MDKLDKQSLLLVAVEMDMPSLLNLCAASERINQLVCKRPQIWIDKLFRDFNFTFLGVPSEIRNPKKYYEILYKQPPNYKFQYNQYSSSHYSGKDKYEKYYLNSLFEAIKYGHIDLVKFLLEKFGKPICEMVYVAIENQHVDIVVYLFQQLKKKFDESCLYMLVKLAVQKENSEVLKLVLKNYGDLDIDEKVVNSVLEKKNLSILFLLAPFIRDKRKYFPIILKMGDVNILKAIYNEKGDYEYELSRSIFADNDEFFKYLMSMNNLHDFDSYFKLNNVKKYVDDIPEKDLKHIVYYIQSVLERRATKILKYFFSFKGIYKYVLSEYKDYIKGHNLGEYVKSLSPETSIFQV